MVKVIPINRIAISYLQRADYANCERYIDSSLAIAMRNNDVENLNRCYNLLANVNERKGNQAKAYEYFFKSLRLEEELVNGRLYADYIGIGEIFRQQQVLDSALHYYFKAIDAWNKNKNSQASQQAPILLAYLGVGTVYAERSNYAEALTYLERVVGAARTEGSIRRLVQGLSVMGDVYRKQGFTRRSLDTLLLALSYAEKIDSRDISADILRNIAQSYKDTLIFDKSIIYAQRSLDTARKYSLKKAASDAAYLLYQIHKQLNDHRRALEYHEKASEYKDLLLIEQRLNQQAILEVSYRLDKTESENSALQKEKNVQKMVIIGGAIGLLCMVVFLGVLVLLNQQRKRLNSRLEFAKATIETSLQNLTTLSEISKEITASLDLEHILGHLYERINHLMDASVFAIGIYQERGNNSVLDYQMTILNDHRVPAYQRTLTDKNQFAVWCLENQQEIFINDVETEYQNFISSFREKVMPPLGKQLQEELQFSEVHYPQSYIYLPLIAKERAIGVLSIASLQKNAYNRQHLELLRAISSQAASALDNATAYNRIALQQEMLEQQAQEIQITNTALQEQLETLRRTQTQLTQAEKMASLGTLVAGVAHELNTPIGVAVTAASTLHGKVEKFESDYQSGALKKSTLETFLEQAKIGADLTLRNLERAANLIQSFKQVAVDQTSDSKRRINLKYYLEGVITSLEPKWKTTQHRVEIDCDEQIELETYPGAIAQIITNLVTNSLMHGFEGYRDDGLMKIVVERDGGRITIEYGDNGRGIAPEVKPRIFDPFFTTKQAQGGTGLGMHIVYNLVTQKLGGEIQCQSEMGKGTAFIVKLPM